MEWQREQHAVYRIHIRVLIRETLLYGTIDRFKTSRLRPRIPCMTQGQSARIDEIPAEILIGIHPGIDLYRPALHLGLTGHPEFLSRMIVVVGLHNDTRPGSNGCQITDVLPGIGPLRANPAQGKSTFSLRL